MFIYCYDELLKEKLIKAGYKMIDKPNSHNYWVFINNKDNLKFDFSNIDSSKFKLSNKMIF